MRGSKDIYEHGLQWLKIDEAKLPAPGPSSCCSIETCTGSNRLKTCSICRVSAHDAAAIQADDMSTFSNRVRHILPDTVLLR